MGKNQAINFPKKEIIKRLLGNILFYLASYSPSAGTLLLPLAAPPVVVGYPGFQVPLSQLQGFIRVVRLLLSQLRELTRAVRLSLPQLRGLIRAVRLSLSQLRLATWTVRLSLPQLQGLIWTVRLSLSQLRLAT